MGDERAYVEDRASPEQPWGAVPPAPLGRGAAYQSVGEVAAPLLAGFSVTLVGVIAQNPSAIRWPGLALVVFVVAAALLLLCVQAAFFARQLYWTKQDLAEWYASGPTGSLEQAFKAMHRDNISSWFRWIERARRAYNAGIVALAIGMAVLLAPPRAYEQEPLSTTESVLRWVACLLALGIAGAEGIWWWSSRRVESRNGQVRRN